jgi:WD40 repeat protein
MRDLGQRFASICQADYARVPTLDEFVSRAGPTLSARHVAVLNMLYARPRRERSTSSAHSKARSWKLRRAAVQTSLAFSPEGQVLASGDRHGRITLRESAAGRTQRSVRLPRSAGCLRALAFAASGDLLAVTADGPNLCVWDVARQRLRQAFSVGGRAVRGVGLSCNAAWLVAAGDDGTVLCWKVAGGRLVGSFSAPAPVTVLAVSPDGRFVAAAGPRAPLTLRQVSGGQAKYRGAADLSAGRGVSCLGFAADGARLAIGAVNGKLTVRQLRHATHVPEVMTLTGPVEVVTLSPDGRAAAATSRDGSIWLRRLPPTPGPPTRKPTPAPVQPLSATRVISSSYRLFDWLRRVALL